MAYISLRANVPKLSVFMGEGASGAWWNGNGWNGTVGSVITLTPFKTELYVFFRLSRLHLRQEPIYFDSLCIAIFKGALSGNTSYT